MSIAPNRQSANDALVSILRTATVVQRHIAQIVERSGITNQQFNVLRILRGAGSAGLPTLAIRDRMIEESAGITRLLDKLEASGFVARGRTTPDRRQVVCHITPAGVRVLAALDAPVQAAPERAMSTLDDAEKQTLIALLGTVRSVFDDRREERPGIE